ncbi:hypothetical protein [Sphingomonas faeni]|uniref:hypothetical protein n=1 Tax=Sphingomonas faeni TaxID=185950 RepID=UPI00335F2811
MAEPDAQKIGCDNGTERYQKTCEKNVSTGADGKKASAVHRSQGHEAEQAQDECQNRQEGDLDAQAICFRHSALPDIVAAVPFAICVRYFVHPFFADFPTKEPVERRSRREPSGAPGFPKLFPMFIPEIVSANR